MAKKYRQKIGKYTIEDKIAEGGDGSCIQGGSILLWNNRSY